MEFLIGRSLTNNITNLMLEPLVARSVETAKQLDWPSVLEQEPDAGLGNGGLGRLAACFIDSLATLQIPAIGYGLRYEYGIFRQEIAGRLPGRAARQLAAPPRPVGGGPARARRSGPARPARSSPRRADRRPSAASRSHLLGVPYDRPVVGYGGKTINTLRLWEAGHARTYFDFGEFSGGDFFGAVSDKVMAESLTRVLYPDDSTPRGRSLRFLQEYFLVRLLAGRHHRPLPPRAATTGPPCRTRSPSSSTTRTRRWPCPS